MRVFLENCQKHTLVDFFQHKFYINSKAFTREERISMRSNNIRPWDVDDLVLFLLSEIGIQEATKLLDSTFTKFGLAINATKTETMTLNIEHQDTIVTIRDTNLKNTTDFKYLGASLNFEEPNTGDTELNHRIQLSRAKFAEKSNLLQNFRIDLRTRISFLNSFVRSRLTYACQNWNLTLAQYERMDVVYRRFLRRMVRNGFRYVDEANNDYRLTISNEQLHTICGTQDLSTFIKSQQSNYLSHVIRMSCERSTKQLLFNSDKCTKRGRPIKTLLEQVTSNQNISISEFCSLALGKKSGRLT